MLDVIKLKEEFIAISNKLEKKLEEVPEDKFFIRPEENKWSVGEVAEHLFKVDTPVVAILQGKKSDIPSDKPERKKIIIERAFSDPDKKFTANGPIVPQDDFDSKVLLIRAIKQIREQISHLIDKVDLTYVCLEFKHPLLGEMTGAEWIHFINLHTERHIKQLKY
ncbi:MAG: PadR family transcriptional regulator [Melioribacteraceae bacterium]|nr:MAG: PadR family transcriptional regulator [Melioribacteraceae bacterium]